jgi:hypothetical protein
LFLCVNAWGHDRIRLLLTTLAAFPTRWVFIGRFSALEECQNAVSAGLWFRVFLSDSLMVMDCVCVRLVSWFGWMVREARSVGGCEIFSEWSNGSQGKGLSGLNTIKDNWFPDLQPIFYVGGSV